jgi:RNA-binding protein
MDLTTKQKAHLRGLAHELNPVVFVGKEGASEAVVRKTHLELEAHELIKVSVGDGAEEDGDAVIGALVEGTGAALVQRIGHVGILYRRRKKKATLVLPK